LRAETPANRLIKACGEKEGQGRFVIIPAGEVATITIGCNWLQNVNRLFSRSGHKPLQFGE
jgi:hypothetical protein